MTLIEKIAYITFWINIVMLIFVFIGISIFFISIPDFFELLISNKGRNPINLSFMILQTAAVFHWGYCIWFWSKFDKYSIAILPLFFLNVLFAPIYYYQVKIKKRPLRNAIK